MAQADFIPRLEKNIALGRRGRNRLYGALSKEGAN
jgi:hypothetical protein